MTMRYFLKADPGDDLENGYAIFLRLEDGAPWALGEALYADGAWQADDDLAAYFLRGSTDVDITEIPAERARQIIVARHSNGWFATLPDPLPGDPGSEDPVRSLAEQAERERLRPVAAAAQADQQRRYAAVPRPEGAADVTVPPAQGYRTVEE